MAKVAREGFERPVVRASPGHHSAYAGESDPFAGMYFEFTPNRAAWGRYAPVPFKTFRSDRQALGAEERSLSTVEAKCRRPSANERPANVDRSCAYRAARRCFDARNANRAQGGRSVGGRKVAWPPLGRG